VNQVFVFLGNVEKMLVGVLVLSLSIGIAAPPAIGTAQSPGRFQVDNSPVSGSATVFEGTRIESRSGAPRVQLQNGSSFEFAPETRATIYGDRAVLEQGGGVVAGSAMPYSVQARSLSIQAADRDGSARVQLAGASRVQVSALRGAVRVRNSQGLLVANLTPGTSLEFDPQIGTANKTRVSGCLQRTAGRFVLTDETTGVTMELRGEGLERELGNNVTVNGTMEAVSDAQAVNVLTIERVGKGCGGRVVKTGTGAAAGAGAGGAVAGSGWALSGTSVAIIGGVAAAATVGGLAAANKLPGQSTSTPTISK